MDRTKLSQFSNQNLNPSLHWVTMAKMLEALKKWYFLHKELKEWWNDSKQNPIMQINLKKISLLSIGVTYEVILSSYIFLMAHKILLQSIAN